MDKVTALEQLRDRLRANYAKIYNPAKVQIGDWTYGIPIVRSWGEDARLKIGKFCSIGENVKVYLGGNHHNDWCTTFPFNALFPEIWGDVDGGVAATKGDVVIGNDVWIADNVIIQSGVTIGDGATLANGAVVTKDVHPYTLVAGNPAEEKRTFYHKVTLGNIRWWDWPLEKLVTAVPYLISPNSQGLLDLHYRWEQANQID